MIGPIRHIDILNTTWVQRLKSNAGFFPWRDGAGLVTLPGGKVLMLGGWESSDVPEWGGMHVTNQVWISTDVGTSWTLLLAHDSDPPATGPGARFKPGHTAGTLCHRASDGITYAYWIGGDANGPETYVYRSPDGVTWEQISTSAPTGDRSLFSVVSYGGFIYIMGGQLDLADPTTALKEVWRSTDDGVTWVQLDDAPWAKRCAIYWPCVHMGEIYLVSGGCYAPLAGDRVFYNDVWKFNGMQWTEVLADGNDMLPGTLYHNVVSLNGRLWRMCGAAVTGNIDLLNVSDDNGVTWSLWGESEWGPSHADGVTIVANRILRASGNVQDTDTYEIYED